MTAMTKPKLLSVVGARPQFIKAAMVSRAIRAAGAVTERLVHTGQHYDAAMSDVFFEELDLPRPAHRLEVGPGPSGRQLGQMVERLDEVFRAEQPDGVLVYGDTTSTLAGALAASMARVPLAHVEAGLRSFDRRMPEEVNRVLTDRLADLLLCPTPPAVENLAAEGITRNVHLVGDVMYDALVAFGHPGNSESDGPRQFGLVAGQYVLLTCHRQGNVDDPARLEQIVLAAASLARLMPVLFPVHPRTRRRLGLHQVESAGCSARACRGHVSPSNTDTAWPRKRGHGTRQFELVGAPESEACRADGLRLVEPLPYRQMLALQRHAAVIVTDSGGIQKEAFMLGVPCVTMREQTEWTETLAAGANRLAGADAGRIVQAVREQLDRTDPLPDAACYGRGEASRQVARRIAQWLSPAQRQLPSPARARGGGGEGTRTSERGHPARNRECGRDARAPDPPSP